MLQQLLTVNLLCSAVATLCPIPPPPSLLPPSSLLLLPSSLLPPPSSLLCPLFFLLTTEPIHFYTIGLGYLALCLLVIVVYIWSIQRQDSRAMLYDNSWIYRLEDIDFDRSEKCLLVLSHFGLPPSSSPTVCSIYCQIS